MYRHLKGIDLENDLNNLDIKFVMDKKKIRLIKRLLIRDWKPFPHDQLELLSDSNHALS